MTTPLGGVLEWQYQTGHYSGNGADYREVQTRLMTPQAGASPYTYSFYWDATAAVPHGGSAVPPATVICWETVRPPNDVELRQTLVAAIGLDEVSAKVRVGPPDDEADDVGLPIWAGQIPLDTVPGPPIVDTAVPADVPMPASVSGYARAFGSARPG